MDIFFFIMTYTLMFLFGVLIAIIIMQVFNERECLNDTMDINDPLEKIKLESALNSEIKKYNYRYEHKPDDLSSIDLTIIYALIHCLKESDLDA